MIKRLYRGPIKSISKRIGLHPYFQRLYYVCFRLAYGPEIIEFEGIKAKFGVSSSKEYSRIKKLYSRNEELRRIIQELRPGDTYWDIGANIGTHSIIPAQVLEDGEVIAFEPFSKNAERITHNAELNGLKNVIVYETALGAEEGQIDLNLEGDSPGTGGHSIITKEGDNWTTVPVIPGDKILEKRNPPDVIKIDVQAAELDVLEGMTDALKSCRAIYCEAHRRRGVSVDDVHEFFEDQGFQVDVIRDSGNTVQLVAKQPSEID